MQAESNARSRAGWGWAARWMRYGGAAALAIAFCQYAFLSWHWPVVNDAALLHYAVLLMQHGEAPYQAVRDINLPGAYLPDWLALTFGGGSDVAWRVYDLGLLLVATAAMVAISYPEDWFAGVYAGGLFALFHGRDGIGQAGQRDLAIAVLSLIGAAALLLGLREFERRRLPSGCLLFLGVGLVLGASTTIKPFGAVFLVVLLGWTLLGASRDRQVRGAAVTAALLGFLIPLGVMLWFLAREHAVGAFVEMCRVTLPFHAAAARPPLAGMFKVLLHSSILKLAPVAPLLMLINRSWRVRETQLVLLGLGFGFFCFFAQRKGYGYHRYPYMAFLLLWVGLECTRALRSPSLLARALGVAGLLFGLCFCVPSYLRSIERARWPESYLHAMEQDLQREGRPNPASALNGRVQCIDSISGCVSVLYRMRLVQASGTLYDEFLFANTASGMPQAVAQARQAISQDLAAHPPKVFIISSWLFPEGPGDYGKLALWPAFAQDLARNYNLVDEQNFPRSENGPLGFRMYVRKQR